MLATLTFIALSVSADKPFDFGPWPNEWKTRNTVMELALGVEIALDLGQSIYSTQQCAKVNCFGGETNPLLPRNPTPGQFYLAGGLALVLHTAIAVVLPTPFREAWQGLWLVLEGANVATNGRPGPMIGMKFSFPIP